MKTLAVLGLIALAGLGVAAVTNPDQNTYEEYAAQAMSRYLKENGCPKLRTFFTNVLESQCVVAIDSNQAQIRSLIASNTKRQNLILFSIYRTDLAIVPPLPTYHFETLGAFQSFVVQKAEQR